jgi:GNAT superfamily N-acetyltransferase
MHSVSEAPGAMTVRSDLRPGDLGAVVHLHGVLYAREYGFDPTFEAYVAGPLAEFVRAAAPGERLWLAERDGRLVGCVAIVAAGARVAQLRWFLVDPAVRGVGLGKRLLQDALSFSRDQGYQSVMLWTVSALMAAAHLYQSAGFHKVQEKRGYLWGVDVIEEQYELVLTEPHPGPSAPVVRR